MLKVCIAPDKFKGSLTGIEFCMAVERGIRNVIEEVEIVSLPLADGGDGTVETLLYHLGGEMVSRVVHDPLMRKIMAGYLYSEIEKTAFIEMASASGICLLSSEEANPMQASSYGTGELIKDALLRGAKKIILGIGGSATNDAGLGMARALGYHFFDASGKELMGIGADLALLHSIDSANVISELQQASIEVACDVDNPLFGPNGAAFVYATQKGAGKAEVETLDKGLKHFNEFIKRTYSIDFQSMKGSGASGGMGAGCSLFLGGVLKPGTELIKSIANFNTKIEGADWVITGEGSFDQQTFSGKVINGILASLDNQKLAIFCGVSMLTDQAIKMHHIHYLDQLIHYATDVEDSMGNAYNYLAHISEIFAKKVLS